MRTIGVRAVVVATTRLSDVLSYEITKGVFEHFEDFRRLHPAFSMLSVADMVNASGRAPLHPGAARYYRERGTCVPAFTQRTNSGSTQRRRQLETV